MTKTPRYQRQPESLGGIKISGRDTDIIKLVHDYRFMDSGQIKSLVSGSNQVILRRLQKLFHHGYLDRPMSQIIFSNPHMGHKNMVYGLGDRGADLLAERFDIDRGNILWKEKNKEAGERYIQHTLMISNFRACLTLGLRETEAKLGWLMRGDSRELRQEVYYNENGKRRKLTVIPDGFFQITDNKGKMYFFLEADLSTMTNSRFLNKMKAYWLWWKQGGQRKLGVENFRILTIAKTTQRLENLIKTTRGAYDQQSGWYMFWFTTMDNIHRWSYKISGERHLWRIRNCVRLWSDGG